jgi:hypothetical protein
MKVLRSTIVIVFASGEVEDALTVAAGASDVRAAVDCAIGFRNTGRSY